MPAKAADVLIAEFVALRAEIMGRISAQAALVGIGLTGLSVVVGLVVREGGDQRLLLALPPLAALVNMLWSIENRRVTLAGAYIRTVLLPSLRTVTSVVGLPCWEDEVAERRRGVRGVMSVFSMLAEGTLLVVFGGAAAAGMIVAADHVDGTLEVFEWGLVGVAVLLPLVFAISNRAAGLPVAGDREVSDSDG